MEILSGLPQMTFVVFKFTEKHKSSHQTVCLQLFLLQTCTLELAHTHSNHITTHLIEVYDAEESICSLSQLNH